MILSRPSALRSLRPCGAELLLSGGARGVILQHAPARKFFDDQEHLGHEIPPLASEIELIQLYGARVLAIALNHEHLAEGDLAPARERIARETGLPAFYPLIDGLDRLVPLVREHVQRELAP